MSSYLCLCGTVIEGRSFPNRNELYLIPQPALYAIKDKLDSLLASPEPRGALAQREMRDMLSTLNPAVKEGVVCPTCGRLHVFFPNGVTAMYFRREDDSDTSSDWLLGPEQPDGEGG
jgi:hypothetical protein